MSNARSFIGLPRKFNNKFLIYPPTVSDVIGNENFSLYRQTLTITAEDIKDAIKKKEGNDT